MAGMYSPQVLLSKQFASFEELATTVVAWDLHIDQLSENVADPTLDQVQAGDLLYSHISCGCFATQQGHTPPGMYTFCLPDADSPFWFFDHNVERPAVVFFGPGGPFDLITRPGYGMSTFSIPAPVFERFFDGEMDALLARMASFEDGVISIPPNALRRLRLQANPLSGTERVNTTSGDVADPSEAPVSRFLNSLCDALPGEECVKLELHTEARGRLLRRAREFVCDHDHEVLSVTELAAAVGSSERTLQREFEREFGLTPKKYLRGQRLYAAHRQLWHADSTATTVADVANEWGFWHLGQFAKDYRRIFGELPSATLNAPHAGHVAK